MARHGIIGWLVPRGHVRQRSPYFPFSTRGIPVATESSRHRGEDAHTLRHQLENGPHIPANVIVEHGGLVAAVTPDCVSVAPPASGIGASVELANRRNVAVAWGTARQIRQVRDAGGRWKACNRRRASTLPEHRRYVREVSGCHAALRHVGAETVHQ